MHRRDHTVAWWIAAASPDRIEQSPGDLALRLIPARAGSASTDERAAWAMMWLLVFDNVENPADLRPYIGALDGYVIATRRRLSTSMEKRSPRPEV
ncbi:hypothetical protein [Streptomyces sp. NPDC056683]|uniref:hypothetical protein n=1 Tax=Streptomyces sp. NPDC056683 TaxID=3345910 RepID=UPI0036CFE1D8